MVKGLPLKNHNKSKINLWHQSKLFILEEIISIIKKKRKEKINAGKNKSMA